jgi:hypothetical protein
MRAGSQPIAEFFRAHIGNRTVKLLARAEHPLQAAIWADTLRAAGITCVVRNTPCPVPARFVPRMRSAALARTRLRRTSGARDPGSCASRCEVRVHARIAVKHRSAVWKLLALRRCAVD